MILEGPMNKCPLTMLVCVLAMAPGCGGDDGDVTSSVQLGIAKCAGLVKSCNVPAPANVRYKLFKRTFDDILAISDAKLKVEMAKQFAGLVDEVDLELRDGDCMEFADRVSRYKTLFDWSLGAMFAAKVEGAYVLKHLINGMARYREACFAIQIESRAATESVEAYEKKCRAICELAAEYEYAMMSLEKSEKGHLQSLSPELHAKYREWKKSIPAWPKAKEVRSQVWKLRTGKGQGGQCLSVIGQEARGAEFTPCKTSSKTDGDDLL